VEVRREGGREGGRASFISTHTPSLLFLPISRHSPEGAARLASFLDSYLRLGMAHALSSTSSS